MFDSELIPKWQSLIIDWLWQHKRWSFYGTLALLESLSQLKNLEKKSIYKRSVGHTCWEQNLDAKNNVERVKNINLKIGKKKSIKLLTNCTFLYEETCWNVKFWKKFQTLLHCWWFVWRVSDQNIILIVFRHTNWFSVWFWLTSKKKCLCTVWWILASRGDTYIV